jgi:hypothetical protein
LRTSQPLLNDPTGILFTAAFRVGRAALDLPDDQTLTVTPVAACDPNHRLDGEPSRSFEVSA